MLIATAGHIDHGKTALVRALTGVDTDRLPEEKARGISIDIGFAYWTIENGHTIGFVDVPGHERFVRNMLAGVGSVDFALLVIAADDGVMPQTVEHLRILQLLGISDVLVVITKCDRVTPDRIMAVRADIASLLAGSDLFQAKVFEVSSVSGAGIKELAAELKQRRSEVRTRFVTERNFRFSIDRVFSIVGAGTVVTGTVLDGAIEPGAHLTLAPQGIEVRVRGLQSASKAIKSAQAGERCAVSISGVEVARIQRGDWLIHSSLYAPTRRVEVLLHALADRDKPIKHNAKVHFYLGAANVAARVLIPSQSAISPDRDGIAQIVLAQPVTAVNGDRFVIRDHSERETIGGGRILDPFFIGRRSATKRDAISRTLQSFQPTACLRGLLDIPHLEIDEQWFARCFNLTATTLNTLYKTVGAAILGAQPRMIIPQSRIEQAQQLITSELTAFHRSHPQVAGMPVRGIESKLTDLLSTHASQALIKSMIDSRKIESGGSFLKISGFTAAVNTAETQLWTRVLAAAAQYGLRPFTTSEIALELGGNENTIRTLLNRKRSDKSDIFQMADNKFFLRSQLADLAKIANELTEKSAPNGFSAAQFRDASGLGRNIVIQILEYLDKIGVTQRTGDLRKMRPNFKRVVGDDRDVPQNSLKV